jgi:NAD(P)H dehydrogenase (quinone)
MRGAQRLNIEHLVKLSAFGASEHSNSAIAREHWAVEQVLQQSRLRWTILRPHAFMQNWLGEVAESVRSEGLIDSPIGDGRVPYIDARDIASVAFEVLVNPEAHTGKKYFLTSGEAVGLADLARALSEVTGRTVRYQPISMDEARSRMQAKGVSTANAPFARLRL